MPALNDFIVFGTAVIGSFLSGGVLLTHCRAVACWLTSPSITVALIMLWLFRRNGMTRLA